MNEREVVSERSSFSVTALHWLQKRGHVPAVLALLSLFLASAYYVGGSMPALKLSVVSTLLLFLIKAQQCTTRVRGVHAGVLAAAFGAAAVLYLVLASRFDAVKVSGVFLVLQGGAFLLLAASSYSGRRPVEHLTPRARIALVTLSALSPAVSHAANNTEWLISNWVITGFFGLFVALAWCCYLIARLASGRRMSKSACATLTAGFVFGFMMLPSVRAELRYSNEYVMHFLPYFAALAVLFHALAKKGFAILAAGLVVFAILPGIDLVAEVYSRERVQREWLEDNTPADIDGLKLSEESNVHVLVYDGIPELGTLEALGIESKDVRDVLAEFGFTLYPDTYTIAIQSVPSMAHTLHMRFASEWPKRFPSHGGAKDHHRKIYAGKNATNAILRLNGYSTHAILEHYLTGPWNYYDLITPGPEGVRLDLAAALVRGVLQGEFRHDTRGILKRPDYAAEKSRAIAAAGTKRFVLSHNRLPGHSQNSGTCRPDETELWRKKLRKAVEIMRDDFEAIEEHDSRALVVAMSDHGPFLTGDCHFLRGRDVNEITELEVLDRFSTLVAIRWPDAEKARKYDGDLVLNQDIFPVVFSYLYDSPLPLSWKPERDVEFMGARIGRKRGLRRYTDRHCTGADAAGVPSPYRAQLQAR